MNMAFLYAIVRFAPYAETEEFANVGIILCVPKLGYFDFKIAPARFKRLSGFFDDVDNKLFGATRNNIEQELLRIRDHAIHESEGHLVSIFKEVTRSRESIIRFGELRSGLLKSKPNEFIDTLYERFIGRDFVTEEYREATMVKSIRKQLRLKGMPKYKKDKISNELIEATFPLVNHDNGLKVIKPLSFQQATTTKIIEHGELWHWKIKRLIKANSLDNKNILLPFEKPDTNNAKLKLAYKEVVDEFVNLNVQVTNYSDSECLIKFVCRDIGPEKFKLSS